MKREHFFDKFYDWALLNGPSFLFGLLFLFIGFWLIKIIARGLSNYFNNRDINPTLKPFLLNMLITVLRVLLILAVMQIMGVRMTIFASLIAALGVAAGLALSGTLQNFASGVLILLLKPFQVGDIIVAQGHEGRVSTIRLFYTVVVTFDNRTVVIPNSKLSNEVIVNMSTLGSRRLDLELKFSNSIDFETVKNLISDTIDQSTQMLETPKRQIGVSTIEPDGYKVMVNVWLDANGFDTNKMSFQQKLIGRLKSSGLKLPGL
jgi:small conductance mechanosensitive channel